eukprot:3873677-Pleurochrysis_carterae.AAC.1
MSGGEQVASAKYNWRTSWSPPRGTRPSSWSNRQSMESGRSGSRTRGYAARQRGAQTGIEDEKVAEPSKKPGQRSLQ